ncbi:uncharacterized protein PV09_03767 [Verruconis gallopava]|uniref:GPI anchored protein n=1 Tax=Verruconis gallopava TaxID=253628 RepID=A0A0D2B1K9_9PEZI|nr:uncharacterized protein PV09_03767 [Verruconis gallopava]KIW05229.1 hypothetical protein PV09_03767 [Verruconis gallopava]
MKGFVRMLSLPPALLALVALSTSTAYSEPQWPYEVPAHIKVYPEDEHLAKRGLSAMEMLATRTPIGVHKMTDDEEEMFFLDYWQFEEDENMQCPNARRSLPAEFANETLDRGLLPPLLAHSNSPSQRRLQDRIPIFARSNIFARDYACPSGTYSCVSIDRPYSCCLTGEVCVSVQDTGLGDVGCCPQGETCNGKVAACNTAAGYKSCPGYSGGGCCIPGFDCSGIGCAINGTETVTTTAPTVTVTGCPASYTSCPASLGGGCCKSGISCGSGGSCLTSSSTSVSVYTTITTYPTSATVAGAPARPTGSSDSGEATTPSTTTVGTEVIAICPTNYYFCSAYYRPGCCRIGRDCSLTNCPSATSSSTLVSNGVTVVVPEGSLIGGSSYVTTAVITGVTVAAATTTLRTGSCQAGWLSCGQDVGGGCCPPNFACGTMCSATAAGYTGVVSKVEPSSGRTLLDVKQGLWVMCLAACASTLIVIGS